MAFSPLKEYSEGNVPEVGTANMYTICDSIESYKPIDVSGLKSAISKAITDTIDNSKNKQKRIKDGIVELSEEWGTKFISIDNDDLNIVDEDNYQKGLDKVSDSLKEQKERCDKLVDLIIDKTEEAKAYIKRIQDNNKNYEELKQKLNKLYNEKDALINSYNAEARKENSNQGTLMNLNFEINSIKSDISAKETELRKYESSKIDSPDGSWVIG